MKYLAPQQRRALSLLPLLITLPFPALLKLKPFQFILDIIQIKISPYITQD